MAKDVRTIITELYYLIQEPSEMINTAMFDIGEGNDKGAFELMRDSKAKLEKAMKKLNELQQIVL